MGATFFNSVTVCNLNKSHLSVHSMGIQISFKTKELTFSNEKVEDSSEVLTAQETVQRKYINQSREILGSLIKMLASYYINEMHFTKAFHIQSTYAKPLKIFHNLKINQFRGSSKLLPSYINIYIYKTQVHYIWTIPSLPTHFNFRQFAKFLPKLLHTSVFGSIQSLNYPLRS